MQQKPDKDDWGHPVGGREKARRKTAATNTGLLHMQASYPLSLTDGELKNLPKLHKKLLQDSVEKPNFQHAVSRAEQ